MDLKYELETLDDLADEVQALYEEAGNGKFRLRVEGVVPEDELGGLKNSLETLRKEKKDAEKVAKTYAQLGKTPEEIQEIMEALEKEKRAKLKDEGEFDKLLAQHKEKWEAEKVSLVSERDSAMAALRKFVGENAFVTELVKAGATEEGAQLLPLSFAKRIKVDIDDGDPVLEVLSADGETPMAGTGKGGRASLSDLVEEAAKKFPSLFKAKGKGGSDTPPNGRGGGKPTRKFNEMSGQELSALRQEDPQQYEALKQEFYGT